MGQYVYGKNMIKQLFKENKKIQELVLQEGFKDKEFELKAKEMHVPIKYLKKAKMDALCQGNHQGVGALIEDYKTYSMEEIVAAIPEGKLPLLVMLDGIEDPHNLGAILRTCDCIGVDGVIIGKHRSVSLTPTVAKVSTGAIETVKVAQVTNLSTTLQQLKKQGYWVVGADIEKAQDYRQPNYDTPLVLVIGSEGFGISNLVKKNCDYCVKLPMLGSVTSLNASVACGILLYEVYAKRP